MRFFEFLRAAAIFKIGLNFINLPRSFTALCYRAREPIKFYVYDYFFADLENIAAAPAAYP